MLFTRNQSHFVELYVSLTWSFSKFIKSYSMSEHWSWAQSKKDTQYVLSKSLFFDHPGTNMIFLYTWRELMVFSFVEYLFSCNGENVRFVMHIHEDQHVNRMPRNMLPRVMKYYSPNGRRNHGRPLKRLLDTWDRNGPTSGLSPRTIYDDDTWSPLIYT